MLKSAGEGRSSSTIAALLLVIGVLLLAYAVLFDVQVPAFVGLGLVFWGVIFSLARGGKYVESGLLDSTAKSAYSTFDRMLNDLKFDGKGYYIPPYPKDTSLPEYLRSLKDPVVFVSEKFNGRPSVDELAAGKFLSEKSNGVFLTCPGSDLMAQMEREVKTDFSRIDMQELVDFLPRCLTETFNLARSVDVSLKDGGVVFNATGLLYQSLYRADPPMRSVCVLGCPVVSAVASILAKASGRCVVIQEQVLSPGNAGVHTVFRFI